MGDSFAGVGALVFLGQEPGVDRFTVSLAFEAFGGVLTPLR